MSVKSELISIFMSVGRINRWVVKSDKRLRTNNNKKVPGTYLVAFMYQDSSRASHQY